MLLPYQAAVKNNVKNQADPHLGRADQKDIVALTTGDTDLEAPNNWVVKECILKCWSSMPLV